MSQFHIQRYCHHGCVDYSFLFLSLAIIHDSISLFRNRHALPTFDRDWLAALPAIYGNVNIESGNRIDPEPANCDPQRWGRPGDFSSTLGFDSARYHPGAAFAMRSKPIGTVGHQATYRANGSAIRTGVAAGSADRGLPGTSNHVDMDVLPFIWAAQLDGNPVEPSPSATIPGSLNQALFFDGPSLNKYFFARPAIANNNLEPAAGECGQ